MTTPSLSEALDEYGRWRCDLGGASPKTWAGEKPGLLAFVDFAFKRGVLLVDFLTRHDVEEWWRALEVADATKTTRLSQLRTFLGYCQQRGWLASDPSALLRARKPIPVVRERLDAGELLALLEATDEPRDRVCLAIASNLALRAGEIQRLRVKDVDLDHEQITVSIDKTRQSDVMPLTTDLVAELRRWFEVYADHYVTQGSFLVPSRYVVRTTGAVLYRQDARLGDPEDVVKQALAKVGWADTKGEGIHTVRRSVARIYFDMIEAEESFDSALLATMTLLHHTRPETTITYIGRDRLGLARDRVLKGKPFLTRLAGEKPRLAVVR